MPHLHTLALGLLAGLVASPLLAQNTDSAAAAPTATAAPAAAGAAPPAASTLPDVAKQFGLFVYPAKQQTPDQQRLDENQCYAWAQQQSSIDPNAAPVNRDSAAAASADQTAQATQGAAVGGAARGAAGGAVVGAIAGDAGKGAAIGAVAGAAGGRRAKRQAEANAANKGAAQADAMNAAQKETFKKAMSVCLEGRGYTVK
jgi:hypothetical protein